MAHASPPLPTTLASRAHPRRLCRAAREAAEFIIDRWNLCLATGGHAADQPPTSIRPYAFRVSTGRQAPGH